MFLMFIFPGSVRGGRVGLDRSVTAMVPSRHHQPASLSLLQPGHGTRVSPQPSSARLDLKTAAATTAGTRRRRRGPDTSCSTGERMTRSRNVGLCPFFSGWVLVRRWSAVLLCWRIRPAALHAAPAPGHRSPAAGLLSSRVSHHHSNPVSPPSNTFSTISRQRFEAFYLGKSRHRHNSRASQF